MARRRERRRLEEEFLATVIELASYAGFAYLYHDRDSRRNRPGMLDLLMAREPSKRWSARFIVAELKIDDRRSRLRRGSFTRRGRWQPGQQEWFDAMSAIFASFGQPGPEVYLWRPSQLEEIKTILWRGYPHGRLP